jgi:predicted N-acetyltransferase YhbS
MGALPEITYQIGGLTEEDFNALSLSAGWGEVEREQARAAVGNALNTIAKDGDTTIGCARVITDGSYQVLIGDVIVRPDYQRQGIGTALVRTLIENLERNRKPGQTYFISLMCAKGKEPFYAKLGFIARPNDEFGAGMCMWIGKE